MTGTHPKKAEPATDVRLKNLRAGNQSRTAAQAAAYTRRLLDALPAQNRQATDKYLRAKRAQGVKPSTLVNHALALTRLNDSTAGTPFHELSPDAIQNTLEQMTGTHSPATVSHWASLIRAYYRYCNDDELPRPIKRALKRRHAQMFRDIQPIEDHEFRALLEQANQGPQRAAAARRVALIWVLWDSGFRISELLGLTVGDVLFDDKGGANLRLSPDAPNLKTGPRTIYVVECVGPIRVWLELHPAGTESAAPLFPSHRDSTTTLWSNNVNKLLDRLTNDAGLRHINPHLFRHTRATRAAAAGWNEPQMRAYFGWSGGSEMPAHYIHLSHRNMEERVRRDAGIDELGQRHNVAMSDADLDRVLKRRLKKLLLEDDD